MTAALTTTLIDARTGNPAAGAFRPAPAPALRRAAEPEAGAGAPAVAAASVRRIGAVAIGRNEGRRLERCLNALTGPAGERLDRVVYVDSGSTDGSVAFARSRGVTVHELDRDRPFTAARARNAGYARLREHGPVDAVLFIDGDCELRPGWLPAAVDRLNADPGLVAAGGRRVERDRERSVYNRLAALEWDRPAGPAASFAGDGLVRAAAFEAVGGFDDTLIAGEEPELCRRLRAAGGRVETLRPDMAVHDAAMTRFGQWWRRARRAGFALGEACVRPGGGRRDGARRLGSVLTFAGLLPAGLLTLAAIGLATGSAWPWALLAAGAALYPALAWRIARRRHAAGASPRDARAYGVFTVLGKFAELTGAAESALGRWTGHRRGLIEYK